MKLLIAPVILALGFVTPAPAKPAHKSSAVVQFHPDALAIPFQTLNERNSLANEREAILSDATLKLAAKTLGLNFKKNPKAFSNLEKGVSTKARKGTDFIEIKVKAKSRDKAALIANAIANAHIKRRNDERKKRFHSDLTILDEELNQQSDLVAKHREALTNLIKSGGIPDTLNPKHLDKAKILRDSISAINEAPEEKKFAVAASLEIHANPVAAAYEKYVVAELQFRKLKSIYLEKHPKHVNARQWLDSCRAQGNKLANELPAILQKRLSNLPDKISLELQTHRYQQVKEDYEQSRALLGKMKLGQQPSRLLLKIPRSLITLHRRAR